MLKKTGINTSDRTRYMREYMAMRRGTKRCLKSEADSACVLLAWESGEISEGVAAKLMGLDRVAARARRLAMIHQGIEIARNDNVTKTTSKDRK